MQCFLIRFSNIPISSKVTKGFIREMHIDIKLWFKLLFYSFLTASRFGHIDCHMVVNVLIFVVFFTTCPMTYSAPVSAKVFVTADEKLRRDENFLTIHNDFVVD